MIIDNKESESGYHNIPGELQEAIDKCKEAQKRLKKRQQKYCINRYYERKKRKPHKQYTLNQLKRRCYMLPSSFLYKK